MKCIFAFTAVVVALFVAGCASPQPTRSCSGRISTDNGHVIRNEEDCTWGPRYSVQSQQQYSVPTQQQPVYVVQQPVQQYWVAQPQVVASSPPFSISIGNVVVSSGVQPSYNVQNVNVRRYRRQ